MDLLSVCLSPRKTWAVMWLKLAIYLEGCLGAEPKKRLKKKIIEAIEGAIEAQVITEAEKKGFIRARNSWHSVPAV